MGVCYRRKLVDGRGVLGTLSRAAGRCDLDGKSATRSTGAIVFALRARRRTAQVVRFRLVQCPHSRQVPAKDGAQTRVKVKSSTYEASPACVPWGPSATASLARNDGVACTRASPSQVKYCLAETYTVQEGLLVHQRSGVDLSICMHPFGFCVFASKAEWTASKTLPGEHSRGGISRRARRLSRAPHRGLGCGRSRRRAARWRRCWTDRSRIDFAQILWSWHRHRSTTKHRLQVLSLSGWSSGLGGKRSGRE